MIGEVTQTFYPVFCAQYSLFVYVVGVVVHSGPNHRCFDVEQRLVEASYIPFFWHRVC